jgi:hypothetical protein
LAYLGAARTREDSWQKLKTWCFDKRSDLQLRLGKSVLRRGSFAGMGTFVSNYYRTDALEDVWDNDWCVRLLFHTWNFVGPEYDGGSVAFGRESTKPPRR